MMVMVVVQLVLDWVVMMVVVVPLPIGLLLQWVVIMVLKEVGLNHL